MNNDNNMGNTNLVQNQANMQVNTSMNNQQVPSANIYTKNPAPNGASFQNQNQGNNGKKKFNLDKKQLIIILVVVVLVIVAAVIFLSIGGKKGNENNANTNQGNNANNTNDINDPNSTGNELKPNTNEGVVGDKIIEGLKFTNSSLVTSEAGSNLITLVTNTTDTNIEVRIIDIIVKDKDGKLLVNMQGYVGGSIPAHDSREVYSSVDMDLSSATDIEYKIVK